VDFLSDILSGFPYCDNTLFANGLSASQAHYVRSTVATNAVTGNRRHVFRTVEDALKHAEAAHGRRLLGAERPFANKVLSQ